MSLSQSPFGIFERLPLSPHHFSFSFAKTTIEFPTFSFKRPCSIGLSRCISRKNSLFQSGKRRALCFGSLLSLICKFSSQCSNFRSMVYSGRRSISSGSCGFSL